MLLAQGFEFTPQQLFFLVAIPNLVGSLIRVPYTLAVPKFGGRNWTMISAALLLIPTLSFAYFVNQPGTPYWAFCLIAATAGFGGGNFACSMANINFFYPARLKGAALGLNAAGGNLGVAIIQFSCPSSSVAPASSAWSRRRRVASTSSARPGSTPGSPSPRSSPRSSSWTTSSTAKSASQGAARRPEEQADLGDVVPLHRHVRLVHRLLRRDAPAHQAQLLAAAGPDGRRASASTSSTTRSSVPSSARCRGRSAATSPTGSAAPRSRWSPSVACWSAASASCGRSACSRPSRRRRTRRRSRRSRPTLRRSPPGRRPDRGRREQRRVPAVPRDVPADLLLHRDRQRLDVQDDPGDLPDRGRAGTGSRPAPPSGRPRSWPAPRRPRRRSASSARSARSAAS